MILLSVLGTVQETSNNKCLIGTQIQSKTNKEINNSCYQKWKVIAKAKIFKILVASYSNINSLAPIKIIKTTIFVSQFWSKWLKSISKKKKKNQNLHNLRKKLILSFNFLKDMENINSKISNPITFHHIELR